MPPDVNALGDKIYQQARQREERELNRLGQIVKLLELESCQVASLCRHFGQELETDCGHCSRCLGESSGGLGQRAGESLSEKDYEVIRLTSADLNRTLPNDVQQARFLCGLPSPAISKARLSKDARFGCLEHLPFLSVLKAIREE